MSSADEKPSLTEVQQASLSHVTVLDTSGSMHDRVLSGAKWSAVSKLGAQGLQFLVGLVLARLLAPAEFGLVASVYVVTGFSLILFEFGLGSALVQLKHPTERDLSTVFWFNVLSGVLFAGVITAVAPFIADFYGQPQLTLIAPLVALSFTLSIGVVHNALLERLLRYKAAAAVDLGAAVVGNVVTVTGALLGGGAYALAIGALVSSAMASVLSMTLVRWRPKHFISRASLGRLWGFSSGMLGFNVVNYWGRNADNLIIGKFLGPASLGLYNRAYNLMLLPINQINGALGRVMFPALSAIQDDLPRVREGYLKALSVINALSLPVMVGIAAVSPALVPLLWGDNWSGVVLPLQILCLAGIPQCVLNSVGWLYQSQGRTRLQFVLSVAVSVPGIVAIVVGLHWGVQGVALAVLARYWLELPITLKVAGNLVGLKLRVVARRILPLLAIATGMGAVVWLGPRLLHADVTAAPVLGAQVLAGVALYVIGVRLFRPALWRQLVAAVGSRVQHA